MISMVIFDACQPPVHPHQKRFVPELERVGSGEFGVGSPDQAMHGPEIAGHWWLGLVATGVCDWFDGRRLRAVQAPALLAVPPEERYGGFDQVRQQVAVWWLVVDVGRLWNGVPGGARILKGMDALGRERTWACGAELETCFRRLRADVERQGPDGALQVRSMLRFLSTEVVRLASAPAPRTQRRAAARRDIPERVKFAQHRLTGDLRQPVPVAEVAEELEMSTAQLYRLFMQHLGMSPKAWVQRARLDRARELLLAGRWVPELYRDLGLASTGDVRRLFVRGVGCQPEQWLATQARLWEANDHG